MTGLAALYWVLATLFVVAPPVLAILADRQARAFQREAFGHLRTAARHIRVMIWAILVYYAAVIGGSAVVGDLGAMVQDPMPARGFVVYLRIGAAIVGYVFMVRVTTALYLMTRPRRA